MDSPSRSRIWSRRSDRNRSCESGSTIASVLWKRPLFSSILQNSIPHETLLTLASLALITAMGIEAWLTKRIPSPAALFAYLLTVVVFPPGMANQYFAIPLAAVAAFPNALSII